MKKPTRTPRPKNDNKRPGKKKPSVLVTEKVDYVDYKDVDLLNRFLSDRSKIKARRVTSNDTQQQREVANAVKNAREMALLPYTKRVATQGRNRPPRDGDSRGDRDAAKGTDNDARNTEVAADVDTETTESED
jgi:small subunit ribosomal protein S18